MTETQAPPPHRPTADSQRAAGAPPCYAALDLGTNNCRLLVGTPAGDGFRVLDSFSRIVRLGEGLHDALNQTITVTEGDKLLKLTRKDLMVRQLVKSALNGEKRALVKLLKLREQVEVQKEEGFQAVMDAGDLAAIGADWEEEARKLRKQQKAWEAQQRKGGASFRELIDTQLARKITVTIRSKPRRMATLEAISIQFVNLAAKGDNSVIDLLL